MRQVFTKKQWFILFNCGTISVAYLTGNLEFTVKSVASFLIALALVNGAALISAKKYMDWKK
jgi:hypothetical protein